MRIVILFICFLVSFQPLRADVVMRLQFQIGAPSNTDNVDIRLFDTVTPSTVANFLNYLEGSTVKGGSYNNSFMHRSVSNFILQGGSYTFDDTQGDFINDPVLNDFKGGFQQIITDTPIPNEFAKSNTQASIAMAKIAASFEDSNGDLCFIQGLDCFLVDGTGPDSATSGWFINLKNNSAELDRQNGGFTVFGEVINSTMLAVDIMASKPVYDRRDIHLALGSDTPPQESLPLVDCIPEVDCISGEIKDNNLIKMIGVTKYFSITPDIDFEPIQSGTITDITVTIDNISSDVLDVTGISIASGLQDPFEIIAGSNCIAAQIPLNGSCQFTVRFSPLVDDQFSDAVNINFGNISLNYSLGLQGLSAQIIEPNISASEVLIDFGTVLVDPTNTFPNLQTIIITNEGVVDLNILSVSFDTQDIDDFHDFENCTVNTPIAPGKLCVLQFDFRPLSAGFKEASFTIISDDPDEKEVIISAFGVGEEDSDGVSFEHESACSESGDCNFDGIADGAQSNVASLKMENDKYITLVTATTLLNNVVAIPVELFQSTDNLPEIDMGILSFSINGFPSGDNTELGLIIPAETTPKTVYMYGPTIDDSNPHWYEFMFDSATGTGAFILENVIFTSQSGEKISKNVITLFFVDGERGDFDMTKNGTISNGFIAIETPRTTSAGGGSMGLFSLLFFSMSLFAKFLLGRNVNNRRKPC